MRKLFFISLIVVLTLSSCFKKNITVSNNTLNETFKAMFVEQTKQSIETIKFNNDKTFSIDIKKDNEVKKINGIYKYDAEKNTGILQFANTTETFICKNKELHIGNNTYCNHSEHKNGHKNNHFTGSHTHNNHNGGNHNGGNHH